MEELRPNRILRKITRDNLGNAKSYTYIILGKPGPTGKTWLCTALKMKGFNAIEITEDICNLVEYNDDRNHYVIDDFNRKVVIVLNQKLK